MDYKVNILFILICVKLSTLKKPNCENSRTLPILLVKQTNMFMKTVSLLLQKNESQCRGTSGDRLTEGEILLLTHSLIAKV